MQNFLGHRAPWREGAFSSVCMVSVTCEAPVPCATEEPSDCSLNPRWLVKRENRRSAELLVYTGQSHDYTKSLKFVLLESNSSMNWFTAPTLFTSIHACQYSLETERRLFQMERILFTVVHRAPDKQIVLSRAC